MHNALWEGDQAFGYEPFHKDVMTAREDEMQKAYEEIAKDKKENV